MGGKLLHLRREESNIWATTICGDCDNNEYCELTGVACLALEMLRQLTLQKPGTQISMLQNVATKFEYNIEGENFNERGQGKEDTGGEPGLNDPEE